MSGTRSTVGRHRDTKREDLLFLLQEEDAVVDEVLAKLRQRRGWKPRRAAVRYARPRYSLDDGDEAVPAYTIEITTDTNAKDKRGLAPKYLHNQTLHEDYLEEYSFVGNDDGVRVEIQHKLDEARTAFLMDDDDDDDSDRKETRFPSGAHAAAALAALPFGLVTACNGDFNISDMVVDSMLCGGGEEGEECDGEDDIVPRQDNRHHQSDGFGPRSKARQEQQQADPTVVKAFMSTRVGIYKNLYNRSNRGEKRHKKQDVRNSGINSKTRTNEDSTPKEIEITTPVVETDHRGRPKARRQSARQSEALYRTNETAVSGKANGRMAPPTSTRVQRQHDDRLLTKHTSARSSQEQDPSPKVTPPSPISVVADGVVNDGTVVPPSRQNHDEHERYESEHTDRNNDGVMLPEVCTPPPSPRRRSVFRRNSTGLSAPDSPSKSVVSHGSSVLSPRRNNSDVSTLHRHNEKVVMLPFRERLVAGPSHRHHDRQATTRGVETQLSVHHTLQDAGSGNTHRVERTHGPHRDRTQQQQRTENVILLAGDPAVQAGAEDRKIFFPPAFANEPPMHYAEIPPPATHDDWTDEETLTDSSLESFPQNLFDNASGVWSTASTSIEDLWLARLVLSRYAQSTGKSLDDLIEDVCDKLDRLDERVFSGQRRRQKTRKGRRYESHRK